MLFKSFHSDEKEEKMKKSEILEDISANASDAFEDFVANHCRLKEGAFMEGEMLRIAFNRFLRHKDSDIILCTESEKEKICHTLLCKKGVEYEGYTNFQGIFKCFYVGVELLSMPS